MKIWKGEYSLEKWMGTPITGAHECMIS